MNKRIFGVGVGLLVVCIILTSVVMTARMLRFNDGTQAPVPTIQMSADKWEVIISYPDQPSAPSLERWKNGRIIATCPRGHHFRVENIDPINEGNVGATATCEPNPSTPAN